MAEIVLCHDMLLNDAFSSREITTSPPRALLTFEPFQYDHYILKLRYTTNRAKFIRARGDFKNHLCDDAERDPSN